MGQLGFFDLGERYRGLDAKKDPRVVLNAVVPWEDFRAQVSVVWRKPEEERTSAAGRKPWDAIVIFTTLVLQALYNQGSRMSLACDDLEHVGVVPGSLLAPAAEAGLGGPVSGDQVESDLAQESEVARSRPVAHAAVIFAEGDVQHPMQCVLNAPMSADRPDQDSGIIVAACEEVADLGLDPAGAVDA